MVGGTAADLSDGDDRLLLTSGAAVTGNLDGGADSDEALLEGTGVFDESFLNFESLTMQGVDWDLGGDSSFGSVAVDAGLLRVNGQVGAGFSFKLTENAAIFAGYDAEFGGDYRAHSINGGLRINW
jgi:outer membrane autotransporter protein